MLVRRANLSPERTSPFLTAPLGVVLAFTIAGHATAADPHVHGLAQLQVGIEGDRLDLMFVSPAVNLVGFEHAPKTDDQRRAVQETVAFFRDEPLIESSSASCAIAEAFISGVATESGSHDENPYERRHDNAGEAEARHSPGHAGHGHVRKPLEHSDVVVTQVLNCDGDWRSGLRTTLLERFKGIESLQVQWAGEAGQGSAVLSQDDAELQL